MPLTGESSPQLAHRFARPSKQALWISSRLQHPFQIGSQRRVLGCVLFPSATLLAYLLPWLIERSHLQLSYPLADRLSSDSCFAGYLADPACAQPLGLCRHIQSPLPPVSPSLHQLVLVFLSQFLHSPSISHPPWIFYLGVPPKEISSSYSILLHICPSVKLPLLFPAPPGNKTTS